MCNTLWLALIRIRIKSIQDLYHRDPIQAAPISYFTLIITPYSSVAFRNMALTQLASNDNQPPPSPPDQSSGTVIPWICSYQRIWRTPNSMEFRGAARVSEIGALEVPWNSMELLVSAKLAHSKFHGIPRNCSCQRNWRSPSLMEFHRIPWNCSWQRNWCTPRSIEFQGTARVSDIGALHVPWNSNEYFLFVIWWNHLVSSILWVLNLDRFRGIWASKLWWKLYSILPEELISVY